jgi:hypothetical protein
VRGTPHFNIVRAETIMDHVDPAFDAANERPTVQEGTKLDAIIGIAAEGGTPIKVVGPAGNTLGAISNSALLKAIRRAIVTDDDDSRPNNQDMMGA